MFDKKRVLKRADSKKSNNNIIAAKINIGKANIHFKYLALVLIKSAKGNNIMADLWNKAAVKINNKNFKILFCFQID